MNVEAVTAKAKVLLEALPYIQDFRGSTIVVKYGGSFMDDPVGDEIIDEFQHVGFADRCLDLEFFA